MKKPKASGETEAATSAIVAALLFLISCFTASAAPSVNRSYLESRWLEDYCLYVTFS